MEIYFLPWTDLSNLSLIDVKSHRKNTTSSPDLLKWKAIWFLRKISWNVWCNPTMLKYFFLEVMQEEWSRKVSKLHSFLIFWSGEKTVANTQQFALVYHFNVFHVLFSEAPLLVIPEKQFTCRESLSSNESA